MKQPSPFPQVVCWRDESVNAVVNPAALGVRSSVFHATHFPSPIRRLNLATVPPTSAPYAEKDLLADFLAKGVERLFCVAAGDSGTGKSHLIRWLTEQAEGEGHRKYRIVKIPRHAANLAQVLRLILADDFKGEAVERIRREIQRTSDLSPQGARTRILDELAFVLEPENRATGRLEFPDDVDHRDILLPLLPAFLRDHAIRSSFGNDQASHIVDRITTHVMGTRPNRSDAPASLQWAASDLQIPSRTSNLAGNAAKELASALAADVRLRRLSADILNRALQEAWPRLLGLQRGNLGVAMLEVRSQLKRQGQELLLFIEDLSVSQGMDAELIEALIVKPSEETTPICALRSIVGVTNEDFRNMRENILGRIDLAVGFDMALGDDDTASVTEEQLISFASRYLNAARFELLDLDEWVRKAEPTEEAPSFCEKSNCPNRAVCWQVFGEVDGRGLYPFSRTAITRLYHQLHGDERTAFNPRILVKNVLGQLLARAAEQIPLGSFAGKNLLEWFSLKEVGADGQNRLAAKYGTDADRARTLIEIYSKRPFDGVLAQNIADKFGLTGAAVEAPATTAETSRPAPGPIPSPTAASQQDEFDRWLNKQKPSDSDVNRWRGLVYNAILGIQDWDSHAMSGWVVELLQRKWIHFEGQQAQVTGDVRITIERGPQAAIALRTLKNMSREPKALAITLEQVYAWAAQFKTEVKRRTKATGSPKPLEVAVHVLIVAGLITGRVNPGASTEVLMLEALAEWPAILPQETGSGAVARLREAAYKLGPNVRSWFLTQAGTLKGRSSDAVFLNTSDVLDWFESARRRVTIEFDDDVLQKWDSKIYEPVRALAGVINQHLAKAVSQAIEQAQKWTSEIDLARGPLSLRDVGLLLKDALRGAREVAALNDQRLEQVLPNVDDLANGRFDEHLDTSRRLRDDTPRNQALASMATLDLMAMERLTQTFTTVGSALKRADGFITEKLKEAGLDDLVTLETETRESVASLRAELENLIADTAHE